MEESLRKLAFGWLVRIILREFHRNFKQALDRKQGQFFATFFKPKEKGHLQPRWFPLFPVCHISIWAVQCLNQQPQNILCYRECVFIKFRKENTYFMRS